MKHEGRLPSAEIQHGVIKLAAQTHTQQTGFRTSSGGNHIPTDQIPILDTIRNNCPDACKQRASEGSKEQTKWERRGGSKALTFALSVKLRNHVKVKEKTSNRINKQDWNAWSKRYATSMFCCHSVYQTGQKLQSTFCRSKWCTVCGRNRSAKITDAYGEVLTSLPDLHFVTLTIKSMEADQLALSIDRMNNAWRKVYNAMTRKGIKPQGGRTLEITHGVKGYHPHYHILISGQENAMMLQSLWMKHFKEEANQGGQYVSPVNLTKGISAVMELVKYSVKPLVDGKILSPEVLHTINVATFGRQMFSPFGIKKVKPQEIEPPEVEVSEADWIKPINTVYSWDQYHREWIDKQGRRLVKWSNIKVDDILMKQRRRKVYKVDTYKK
jgi:hypothetical protein